MPPQSSPEEKVDLAVAILLRAPEISPTKLAEQVGVARSTLYSKRGKWQPVRQTLTARDAGRMAKGAKSADGDLDAEGEDREFHPAHPDRA